jgi:hypothetical protein
LAQLSITNFVAPIVTDVEIFPNPFHNQLYINFKQKAENIRLDVFDIFGRKVFSKNMDNSDLFIWNGCDNEGNKLKSSIFIIQLTNTHNKLQFVSRVILN